MSARSVTVTAATVLATLALATIVLAPLAGSHSEDNEDNEDKEDSATLIPLTFTAADIDGLYAVDVVPAPPRTWTLRVGRNAPASTVEVRFDTAYPEWVEPGAGPGTIEPEHSELHAR